MKPSFLALKKPAVVCILAEPTVEDAVAVMKNGEFDGADAFAVHLRMDRALLTEENLRRLADATRRPVMFLLYRWDAAAWPHTPEDEERVELLKLAVRAGGAAVDLTADTFDPSSREFSRNPAAIDRQMRAIEEIHTLGGEVVMSSHIPGEALSTEEVLAHMLALERRGADFVKIVTNADTDAQFAEAVKTTLALRRTLRTPFIHLVLGKFARPHRFLAPNLGSALTFCVQRYSASFLSVLPPISAMRTVLDNMRWHIDDTDD